MRLFVFFSLLLGVVIGAVAQPPPPGCDPEAPLANGPPATSPDEQYTVWVECYAPDEPAYTIYSTHHATGETLTLGEVTDTRRGVTGGTINYVYVARWLDDTRLVLRAETGAGTYNWRYAFLADASRAGSVQRIAADYVARPRFDDDPARFIWADENGITETITVYQYDVETGEQHELYQGPCLPRDDLQNRLSCHMVTVSTNAGYTEGGTPTRMLFNVGDSAREIKTIEVRSLPGGGLLHTVDALGAGYGEWIAADTAALFNLAFDFDNGGFSGVFLQFDEDGRIISTQDFVLPSGAQLTERPAWLPED